MDESTKTLVDWAAFGNTIAVLAGWLPAVAGAVTIVWTLLRIYESNTVQKLLGRHRGPDAK